MTTINFDKLSEPFAANDIEWRIGQAGKTNDGVWAKALAYMTSRAVMDRLDDVCGPENWRNEFQAGPNGGTVCGISIRIDGEWVTKWDGADNTQVEGVKGGLSDAMKRAAVQWGIGRYLYNLDATYVKTSTEKRNDWNYQGQSKDGKTPTFWWQTPALPAWALPDAKPVAERKPDPAPQAPQPEARQDGEKIGQTFNAAIYDAIVNAKLAQHANHARNMLDRSNLPANVSEAVAISWARHYRAARDADNSGDDAAQQANDAYTAYVNKK